MRPAWPPSRLKYHREDVKLAGQVRTSLWNVTERTQVELTGRIVGPEPMVSPVTGARAVFGVCRFVARGPGHDDSVLGATWSRLAGRGPIVSGHHEIGSVRWGAW